MADVTQRAQFKWMTLHEGKFGTPYVNIRSGVVAVPVTRDSDVLMVREHAIYDDTMRLVIPGGGLEVGETIEACINRELQEEIGYRAASLVQLGELQPLSKYMTAVVTIFLARDLHPSALEGDEVVDLKTTLTRIPLATFDAHIGGELVDSSVIAALYMARHYLQNQAIG